MAHIRVRSLAVHAQDSLLLDVDDACHTLTVETGGPIFSVALQSDVLLDLEESPVAILSRSPPDPATSSLTLATYRCSCPRRQSGVNHELHVD